MTFISYFLPLLAAHLLGDFLFQTSSDVARKSELRVQFKHSAIHGILALALLGSWRFWLVAAVVTLSHFLIDWIKVHLGKRAVGIGAFTGDQAAHLVVLCACAEILRVNPQSIPWIEAFGATYLQIHAVVCGSVVAIFAGGVVVGMAVRPFLDEIDADGADERKSGLRHAGKVIGWLERGFILFFVLIGRPDAVGFLIAAKSILRFGEIKDGRDRKEAEYIIIGTLMSFGWALVWAWAAGRALEAL